jgi:hypothetical protein
MIIDERLLKSEIEYAEGVSRNYPERREQVFVAILVASLISKQASVPNDGGSPRARKGEEVPPVGRSFTASELFARLRPGLNTDKILGAAYFLDAVRHVEGFTADELKGLLLEAKVAPPKNTSLAALRNAQKGLMAQRSRDGKKISWMITQTGIEAVQERLQEVSDPSKNTSAN